MNSFRSFSIQLTQLREFIQQLLFVGLLLSFSKTGLYSGSDPKVDVSYGHQMMLQYFAAEIDRLDKEWIDSINSLDDFENKVQEWRRQYAKMLGLWPMPERTDLRPVVTGSLVRDGIEVRRVHFQSMPGLYVTANLYLPAEREGPLPAVLYLPGHTRVIRDGVSYGPKVSNFYQTHPIWYAQNGIIALITDTLHAGEVRGVHHGIYRYNRWWWFNRGYTPGGVETWNAIRALDYLETLDEVDASRLAVTGLSGGGAVSWSVNALDRRPLTVVPVAGLTDLYSYLVDELIDLHCDCIFSVNRFRWDTPQITALGAPRSVLFSNNDNDHLFPLDGIMRVYEKLADVYNRIGYGDKLELLVREGGHADIPQRPDMFRFIHEKLTGKTLPESSYEIPDPMFTAEELKVFQGELPRIERNSVIDEEFILPVVLPAPPQNTAEWERSKEGWLNQLSNRVFHGWPSAQKEPGGNVMEEIEVGDLRIRSVDFLTQSSVQLRLWLIEENTASETRRVELQLLDKGDWKQWISALLSKASVETVAQILGQGAFATEWPEPSLEEFEDLFQRVTQEGSVLVIIAPRGVGPTNWMSPDAPRDSIRRSFAKIGQTRDGMRIWDVRQSIRVLRDLYNHEGIRFEIHASGVMAGIALYASLFEEVDLLKLDSLPTNHRNGPILFDIDHVWEMQQALTAAAERVPIQLLRTEPAAFEWAIQAMHTLGITDRVSIAQ